MKIALRICCLFWIYSFCTECKIIQKSEVKTSFGTDFVFVFPLFLYNIDQVSTNTLELYVLITNQDSSSNNVNLIMPNGSIIPYQLMQGQSKQVVFTDTSLLVSQNNANNILIVSASDEVSVHGGIMCNNIGDSFLVLPTNALDSHYIVTTAGNSTNAVNQIIVVPTKDQPALVTHPSCSGTTKNSVNVSFPAAYVIACSQDLSGYVITSNTTIAVMSGLISYDNDDKFGVEMLIPDKYWGTSFILTNLTNTQSSSFKIVASRDGTVVYNNCVQRTELNLGDWFIINQQSPERNYIGSNYPVSIFQIPSYNDDNLSMYLQILPISDLNTFFDLHFAIPTLNNVDNYLTIQQIGSASLAIDGFQIQTSNNLFDDMYSRHYNGFFSGGVTSLHFNVTAVPNSLFLSSTNTLSTSYSMVQYGMSRSSVVYGHNTAAMLKLSAVNISNVCEITIIIHVLANTTIANVTDVTTALIILNDTLKLVNQTGYPLTPTDLNNVANILCNCAVVSGLLDQDFFLYMDCFNSVFDQNIQTIRDAQAIYNTSINYQVCLQYMASNTVNSSLIYNNYNIAAANLDTDCSQIDSSDTSAVAFVQYSNFSIQLISNLTARWLANEPTAFAILPAASLCSFAHLSQTGIVRNDFVLYRGQQFFGSESNNFSTVGNPGGCSILRVPQTSYVMTIKILTNMTEFPVQLSQPVSYGFSVAKTDKSLHSKTLCGYWDLEWYTNGCYLNKVQGDLYICQSTHLTDFSLLVDSSAIDPALCDQSLQILGTVLAVLSIVGLLTTLLLTVFRKTKFLTQFAFLKFLFENNRKTKSIVGDTLLVTLFLFYILFAMLSDSRVTNMSAVGCNVSGAVLYTVLFATMFFAAFCGLTFFKVYYIVFRHDVLNFLTSKLFIVAVSLGIPTLITIILWFAFNPFFVRNDCFCWINPTYVAYAVVIPTIILLIADVVITAMLIKGFFFAGNNSIQSAKGRKKMIIKKVFVLATVQFILACPWVFEYFTIGTPEVTAYHYLFTLTNGSQGIWLSIIYLYSFFQFTKNCRRVQKKGETNVNSVPTMSTQDTVDNKKFPNGIAKPLKPVAVMNHAMGNETDLSTISASATPEPELRPHSKKPENSRNNKKKMFLLAEKPGVGRWLNWLHDAPAKAYRKVEKLF